MTTKRSITAAAAAFLALLVALAVAVAVALAGLPGRLDEFLLTDDDYCYYSLWDDDASGGRGRKRRRRAVPSVHIDYGDYERTIMRSHDSDRDRAQQPRAATIGSVDRGLRQRVSRSVLWRISLRLWEQFTNDDDQSAATVTSTCPIGTEGDHDMHLESPIDNEGYMPFNGVQSRRLHPMCRSYRKLRSRLRFQDLALPWNWYYRNELHVRNLALRSSADEVSFVSGEDDSDVHWWNVGWDFISGKDFRRDHGIFSRVNVVPRAEDDPGEESEHSPSDDVHYSVSHLPPAVEIGAMEVSFQSWVHPIVSAQLHGVTVNVVIQNGRLPLPLQMNGRDVVNAVNSSALLVGAMPIQEVLLLMPRPPEIHGLYPRIGLVNITNVTLCVYESKVIQGGAYVNLLLKMGIPDKLFLPITNLTLAHKQTGIDQKDFQPMMESSISDALRRHLLREATAAFHNSWAQTQHFIENAQELYLERWFSMGVQALHQTQENVWNGLVNGTVPLVRAVEEWVTDLKDIISEPVPPLAAIASHYWNRMIEGIDRHGIVIDDKKKLWVHLDDTFGKWTNFKHEKKISKQINELKEFFARSGQDVDLLLKSCELEVKDMWLSWRRQFMPEL